MIGQKKRKNSKEEINMETRVVTCTICENKCPVKVKTEKGEVLEITGNLCPRGAINAEDEIRREDL